MKLTTEQLNILKTIEKDDINFLKISAVSGAGKTSTLVKIVETLIPKKALYITFNKSMALEAKQKFNSNVECLTVHALAFRYVMNTLKKKDIENFTIYSIKEYLPMDDKYIILDLINSYFTSNLITKTNPYKETTKLEKIANRYINDIMLNKSNPSFNTLLKLFHIYLFNKNINFPKYDLIMMDESGDTTEVSIEIFNLLDADKKVMVGDPDQNIYTFMNTVNGFEVLKDKGKLLPLTQSFRVSEEVANRVQRFVNLTFNRSMVFKGIHIPENYESKTFAYIARTNSYLIQRIIDLNSKGIRYSLLKPAKEIFSLPLILINLKEDSKIYDKEYKFLVKELIEFNSNESLQKAYKKSFLSYIEKEYSLNIPLVSAIKLLRKNSYSTIFNAYNIAKTYDNRRTNIVLTTTHLSKGLEFDEVYIEDDTNIVVNSILEKGFYTEDDITELRLAYVAVTRCRVKIHNAKFL